MSETIAGCFVLKLVENNSGFPNVGMPRQLYNCDGTVQHLPRHSGVGFGPTAHSPAYEWQWVQECDCRTPQEDV